MKVNVVNLIIFSYSSGCRKRKKRKSGPEEEIVVAYGCRKGKKRICGLEEEIVVAASFPPLIQLALAIYT